MKTKQKVDDILNKVRNNTDVEKQKTKQKT